MKNAFTEIFTYSFKLFSCIVTFLLLPLSFIYNANALLAVSYPFNIACDLSIVQLILLALSLTVSVVLGILSLTTYSLVKNNGVQILRKLISISAILIIVGYVFRYMRFWIVETFKVPMFPLLKWLPLTVIISTSVVLLYLFYKYLNLEFSDKILKGLFKFVKLTLIASLVLLSVRVVIYVNDHGTHSELVNNDNSHKLEAVSQPIDSYTKGISNSRPNIILVTFDALAAGDMSLYGYHFNTTPNIDALAKGSYVFDNMIANSNWTRPSSASIIIGKYPNAINNIFAVNYSTQKMSIEHENLARVLRAAGYKTAAITSNYYTHPLQNMTFRDFDYLPRVNINKVLLLPLDKILSFIPYKFYSLNTFGVLLNDILSPIDSILITSIPGHFSRTFYPPNLTFQNSMKFILNTKSPIFIWIHILPPHRPYWPSKKFIYKLLDEKIYDSYSGGQTDIRRQQYPRDQQHLVNKWRLRYNENIMYADDEFGEFVKSLSSNGIYENSILIVSSDHGESFNKGYLGHGGTRLENLYQQCIQVPLVIHLPKQQIGKRIKSNAEHVDLAPTILDLLNMNVPKWMQGESLKGAMYGNQITKKQKYSMSFATVTVNKPPSEGAIAVIKGDYKYIFQIEDNRGELYDIKNDPNEERNLVNTERRIAEDLKKMVIIKLYHKEIKKVTVDAIS